MASNVEIGVGRAAVAPACNNAGGRSTAILGGRGQGGGRGQTSRQQSINWSHSETIALITCKGKEHAAQKQLLDPRSKMVSAAQKWQKILTELQAMTHSRTPRLSKCCKDKWNTMNADYRKISDYHKGTGHHTSFWSMSIEDKDRFQLPRQFDSDFYEAIEAFQGERNINTPRHLRDSQGEGDSVFADANNRSPAIPVLDVLGDIQANNCVRLDDSPEPFFNSRVVNLTPIPVSPSLVNLSGTLASVGATFWPPASLGPHDVPGSIPSPGNTLVKRKRSSVFTPIMEATDKSSRVLVEAMDRLNATQQDLEKIRARQHKLSNKKQLEYMKARDRKAHKISKKVVNVLSNLSTAMCHAFISDPSQIPPPVIMSQSSDEQPPRSLHVIDSSIDEE